MEGGVNYAIAQSKDGCWIYQAVAREIDENSISEFTAFCKGLKCKTLRKVIIALDGIDTNAKMLAKEAKIWIWGLEDLNFLMDVFRKPRIIFY